MEGDFPGGPMVKTLPSNAAGVGSITGQGAKIPYLMAKKPKHKTEAILQKNQKRLKKKQSTSKKYFLKI